MDFDEEDPFVPVWEGPFADAQRMLQHVEQAHIPVDLDDATLVGQARVVVPRSYAEDARAAIAGDAANMPGLIPDVRPSWRRWVIVAVAVLAIVALLATMT